MSLGLLATHEGVKPPSMTRTAGLLESRGLVSRKPDPNDGRAVVLSATSEGRKVFRQGHERLLRPLVLKLEALNLEERERIHQALGSIVEMIDAMSSAPGDRTDSDIGSSRIRF